MDDDFILLQIYDETQDEVRDKDLEVRKIEAKVQKIFIILFIQCITDVIFPLISVYSFLEQTTCLYIFITSRKYWNFFLCRDMKSIFFYTLGTCSLTQMIYHM